VGLGVDERLFVEVGVFVGVGDGVRVLDDVGVPVRVLDGEGEADPYSAEPAGQYCVPTHAMGFVEPIGQ
jgi:hypothetical protein